MHSHQEHLYALLRMAKQNGVERVFVHCFMDGRDTLPTTGAGYIEQLQQKMREYGAGKIATVNGRYYAMDRDRRWERMQGLRRHGARQSRGGKYADPVQGMKESYNRGVTDEFVVPFVCADSRGEPLATIGDEDACINFNFRADRARQITRALAARAGSPPKAGAICRRRRAGRDHSARARAEEPELRLHDRYDNNSACPWWCLRNR